MATGAVTAAAGVVDVYALVTGQRGPRGRRPVP
jgi:hypothetical protein